MKKDDLDAVFIGPEAEGEEPPLDEMPPVEPDDDTESAEALDAAIDEAFDASDPVARREAFKRAVAMCHEGDY